MNKGIVHGFLAYVFWGLFPIFWKQLLEVESFQIIAHRIVWSFVLMVSLMIFLTKTGKESFPFPGKAVLKIYAIASILIGINWFLYVWAVNSEQIVESSLGYFMTPLFSVTLGLAFFKERLRPAQWFALSLAASGVLYLSFALNSVPWIAISLALSFSLYGMVKKLAPLHPMQGLSLETGALLLPALAFLILRESEGMGAFLNYGRITDVKLIFTGLITTLPLLLFASAARKIPLTMLGFLQYVSPTLQLVCGVFIYKEEFSQRQMIGFGIVWLALAIFALEGYRWNSKKGKAVD
jgi:chloramphenicol-sensitive protein RarD